MKICQDQFLQGLELDCLGWLLTEDRVGKLDSLRWKLDLQFPIGHFLVRDVVVQYDRGVLQCCGHELIVNWRCPSAHVPVMRTHAY